MNDAALICTSTTRQAYTDSAPFLAVRIIDTGDAGIRIAARSHSCTEVVAIGCAHDTGTTRRSRVAHREFRFVAVARLRAGLPTSTSIDSTVVATWLAVRVQPVNAVELIFFIAAKKEDGRRQKCES
jgi:hypothetical protein